MEKTPKGMRLTIGFFGKRNVGKSSLINNITGQLTSIVSDVAGTTTDVVEKSMEMLPIGPIRLIDTAGVDDVGELGLQRIDVTYKALERTDIAVLVIDYNGLTSYDIDLIEKFNELKTPYIIVINKSDEEKINFEKIGEIKNYTYDFIETSANYDTNLATIFKNLLLKKVPEDYFQSQNIVADLVKKQDVVILVTPIDKQAPKGRLILPQVQVLRELLDNGIISVVVQVEELEETLKSLNKKPALVITDSQAFKEVDKIVSDDIQLTSFSILFARFKGDLREFQEGANAISQLQDNDKVLICESCTHHQIEDDIGTVKIPNLIRQKTGKELIFEKVSSSDFPNDIEKYKLIIHCGACMTNRKEILSRIQKSNAKNVPITNYGVAIYYCLGILDRALKIF
ncbi:[FeFe] hydrogenase H-cluster maturation GTPase HydF [bacterium]|nr:[FeFe] hydrogenase H-cluster maturation GTPase HydF [bacterium]